jgi:hypothetical protein
MKDMKKNNLSAKPYRTKQLGLKFSEEFYWEVKELALQERHSITETIEDSVYFYKIYKKHLTEAHEEVKRERERERLSIQKKQAKRNHANQTTANIVNS